MRRSLTILLVVVGLVSLGYAGTLRNRDFRQYHLEMQFPDGRIGRITIAGDATLSGFCAYDGCYVVLLETRDAAQVGPNDDVVIFYGRLQVRRSWLR